MSKKRLIFWLVILLGGLVLTDFIFLYLSPRPLAIPDSPSPNPSPPPVSSRSPSPSIDNPPPPLPASFLINDVPFTVQAPAANWDADHEEFCEEAAVLVAAAYFRRDEGENIPVAEAEAELQAIAQWEREQFGLFEDTSAELTSRILVEKYQLKAAVEDSPTAEDIKKILYEKKLVLVPAAGRLLKNPYFQQPGPVYHMLVVIGWDNDDFIVQDVGTKRGRHYRYSSKILLTALHDLYPNATPPLDESKILEGEKKIIVVSP